MDDWFEAANGHINVDGRVAAKADQAMFEIANWMGASRVEPASEWLGKEASE
ncbi:hypothetical protein [Burkholderia territorii]|uniref:hypothetical protein n=1 Tax=Burkholderia territorii TaxID=1503055 RepID=UPI000A91E1D6|nr:hypothetical protein [Burkholderia territorii]